MDLEAPRDEVLTQKDQANTCVSTAWLRLRVHGIQNGRRYLVKKDGEGWRIEPAPQTRRRAGQAAQAKRELTDHLDALATEGFSFEPEKKENVPPCRF
jgi:hypothetical protein